MFLINFDDNKIIRLSDFQSISLNEIALFLLDAILLSNKSLTELAVYFDIDPIILQTDIKDLFADLENNGFYLTKDNVLSSRDISFDLSKIWLPVTPIIHIIQNCNSPCITCDCLQVKPKNWHSLEILKPLFKRLKNKGATSIMLSGGEPLMHPELKQILEFLNDLKLSVELNTNAILLHKNLWILDYNLKEIVISMDGFTSEDYFFIRGVNKFNQIWETITKIKEIAPAQNIGLRVTLTKAILCNLPKAIDFFLDNGINYIGFSPLDTISSSFSRKHNNNERSARLKEQLIPSESILMTICNELENKNSFLYNYLKEKYELGKLSWDPASFLTCVKYYMNANSAYIDSSTICLFPFSSLVLDYNGDLKNCFYSAAFGNINDYNNIDWTSRISLQQLNEQGSCRGCRGKVFCG